VSLGIDVNHVPQQKGSMKINGDYIERRLRAKIASTCISPTSRRLGSFGASCGFHAIAEHCPLKVY
jgi:hypothetical protein